MATFDAEAYRAAREPFRLIAGGRIYTARPVSAELVIALRPALASSEDATRRRALVQLLRAAFPWRWRYLFGDPVRALLRLDVESQREALRRFFRFLGVGSNARAPGTPGIS